MYVYLGVGTSTDLGMHPVQCLRSCLPESAICTFPDRTLLSLRDPASPLMTLLYFQNSIMQLLMYNDCIKS